MLTGLRKPAAKARDLAYLMDLLKDGVHAAVVGSTLPASTSPSMPTASSRGGASRAASSSTSGFHARPPLISTWRCPCSG